MSDTNHNSTNFNKNSTLRVHHKSKMKIFESIIKYFAAIGITAQSRPFNMQNLLTFVVFAIMMVVVGEFLFFEASSFREYTESIYISSIIFTIFVTFLFIIWKRENIFQFIDCFEKIAETSKYICSVPIMNRFVFSICG